MKWKYYNTEIKIENENLLKKIQNDLKEYLSLNKLKEEDFFWKSLFWFTTNKIKWDIKGSYHHLDINNHYRDIKDSKIFKTYMNWQIIEYYLIKNINESQLQNNKKISNIIKYVKENNYIKVNIIANRIKKEAFLKYDNKRYLNICFKQNNIRYEKNIENMMIWYIWEMLYWSFLIKQVKRWNIKNFIWTNKFKADITLKKDWISCLYEIEEESWYDYKIKTNKWENIYIDLKTLEINKTSDEILDKWSIKNPQNWRIQNFDSYRFYVKIEHIDKANRKWLNIYYVPLWYNKKQNLYIYSLNNALSSNFVKNNLQEIIRNTNYIINNKQFYKYDWQISQKIPFMIQRTKKESLKENTWIWKTCKIQMLWKTIDIPEMKTNNWNSIDNIVIYYWKYAEYHRKKMIKIK